MAAALASGRRPRRPHAMPAAPRLLVAFLALIAAFVALVGVAVASLFAAGQHALAAVVAIAGLAGVGAGAFTYWLLRRDVIEEESDTLPLMMMEESIFIQPPLRRGPVRVHSMPVANLPPA